MNQATPSALTSRAISRAFRNRPRHALLVQSLAVWVALSLLMAFAGAEEAEKAHPWWDAKWTARRSIVIDTSDKGVAITEPVGAAPLLLRLHDGNFDFMSAREDGSDLRFVGDDNKTLLPHHIEKWDGLLNEAYVWVGVPDLKPAASTTVWLYYGNHTDAAKAEDEKATYDGDTTGVFHFGDAATVGKDASGNGLALEGTNPPGAGAIGSGMRLLGQNAITIPAAPPLVWIPGGSFTFSTWIKPAAPNATGVIFSRREGTSSFVIGLEGGAPYIQIGGQRRAGGAIAPGAWSHLAVTVGSGKAVVFVNGASVATLAASLPAMNAPCLLGRDSTGSAPGFVGDLDEVQFAKAARPTGSIAFAAISQGNTSDAGKLVAVGANEASGHHEEGELMKHLSLLSDISKDLTFDGWVVIVLCIILAAVGWVIAIGKFLYLNKISKATNAFLERWEKMSADLTALDEGDDDAIKSMGGTATSKKAQRLMHQSPLYHIYHLGCHEIQNRVKSVRQISLSPQERFARGLSGRSIQAIKATLHGGLVREVQKLNGKLVFLTIGIAGGPYLGLLGTVIGVMITFAVIAKTGQVEVNSIAPGIAGALLATVAGLAVAIPALFAYSYLSSRIKDAVSDMETFIDEFVAKMAEHYKE
jgi:biopolymer transport protein ExbB